MSQSASYPPGDVALSESSAVLLANRRSALLVTFVPDKAILLIVVLEDRFVVMDSRFSKAVMVIDNGSIAETARRLNITAAGVAQRIHALEAEIGNATHRQVRPPGEADRGRYCDSWTGPAKCWPTFAISNPPRSMVSSRTTPIGRQRAQALGAVA